MDRRRCKRAVCCDIESGPTNSSLLYLQSRHVSEAAWRGYNRVLKVRRSMNVGYHYPPIEIVSNLVRAGFYGVARVGHIIYDHSLVSAFVERWRPETHTFHMPQGECTITLQDVAILLGLPIDGQPVIGHFPENNQQMCLDLFGIAPGIDDFRGNKLKLAWLTKNFGSHAIPPNATPLQLLQWTRAYILQLIGGFLFPDNTSGIYVSCLFLPLVEDLDECGKYSWGSALLANLYREMCCATDMTRMEIGGCAHLLHLWAWERFPMLAPEIKKRHVKRLPDEEESQNYPIPQPYGFRWSDHKKLNEAPDHMLVCYRLMIDRMLDTEICWEPYKRALSRNLIPDYCLEGIDLWRAHVPLIFTNIVEWHQTDRVMRQFGLDQPIPEKPVNLDWEHTQQLKGKTESNWTNEMEIYTDYWKVRDTRIVRGDHLQAPLKRSSQYMRWYWDHTRKWMDPEGAIFSLMAEKLTSIQSASRVDPPPLGEIDKCAGELLQILKPFVNCAGLEEDHRAPLPVLFPQPKGEGRVARTRRAGFLKTRLTVEKILPLDVDDDADANDDDDNDDDGVNGDGGDLGGGNGDDNGDNGGGDVGDGDDIGGGDHRGYGDISGHHSFRSTYQYDSGQSSRPVLTPSSQCDLVNESLTLSNNEASGDVVEEPLPPPPPDSAATTINYLVSSSTPLEHQMPLSWPHDGKPNLDWIHNLMACFNWSSWNVLPSRFPTVLPIHVFDSLILAASKILHEEPNIVSIDPFQSNSEFGDGGPSNVVVVGDVHGQLHDVLFLLKDAGYPSQDRIFVFNGDYVDRGAWGLETFLLLLAWKVFMPHTIYLLRGNHETQDCTSYFGFEREVLEKYRGEGKHVYQKCLECFKDLPLASVIAGRVYTAHGGLFRNVTVASSKRSSKRLREKKRRKINDDVGTLSLGSLEELSKVQRSMLNPPGEGEAEAFDLILGDVLWSDPSRNPGLALNVKRDIGLLWGPDCTEEFLKKHQLKLIIRSHEGPDARDKTDDLDGMDEGYTIDHIVESGKLITLFSAPDYPQFQATEKRFKNKGAYIVLEAPNFDTPKFRSFEAVTPRPKVDAYYDYAVLVDSDEEYGRA